MEKKFFPDKFPFIDQIVYMLVLFFNWNRGNPHLMLLMFEVKKRLFVQKDSYALHVYILQLNSCKILISS